MVVVFFRVPASVAWGPRGAGVSPEPGTSIHPVPWCLCVLDPGGARHAKVSGVLYSMGSLRHNTRSLVTWAWYETTLCSPRGPSSECMRGPLVLHGGRKVPFPTPTPASSPPLTHAHVGRPMG